jgi:TPR repeat protein
MDKNARMLTIIVLGILHAAAPYFLMAEESPILTSAAPRAGSVTELTVKAKEAIKQKKLEEAVSLYTQAAQLGDASSMYEIGQIYDAKYGIDDFVLKNHASEKEDWYRKAADLGNAPAMVELGWIYKEKGGKDKEARLDWYKKSFDLYQKSADLGHAPAMVQLGILYNGDGSYGVPSDPAKAAEYYRKAVELGNAQAMNNLGVMTAQGRGVPKDIDEAVRLWKKAVEIGDPSVKSAAQSWLDAREGKPIFPRVHKIPNK